LSFVNVKMGYIFLTMYIRYFVSDLCPDSLSSYLYINEESFKTLKFNFVFSIVSFSILTFEPVFWMQIHNRAPLLI